MIQPAGLLTATAQLIPRSRPWVSGVAETLGICYSHGLLTAYETKQGYHIAVKRNLHYQSPKNSELSI